MRSPTGTSSRPSLPSAGGRARARTRERRCPRCRTLQDTRSPPKELERCIPEDDVGVHDPRTDRPRVGGRNRRPARRVAKEDQVDVVVRVRRLHAGTAVHEAECARLLLPGIGSRPDCALERHAGEIQVGAVDDVRHLRLTPRAEGEIRKRVGAPQQGRGHHRQARCERRSQERHSASGHWRRRARAGCRSASGWCPGHGWTRRASSGFVRAGAERTSRAAFDGRRRPRARQEQTAPDPRR